MEGIFSQEEIDDLLSAKSAEDSIDPLTDKDREEIIAYNKKQEEIKELTEEVRPLVKDLMEDYTKKNPKFSGIMSQEEIDDILCDNTKEDRDITEEEEKILFYHKNKSKRKKDPTDGFLLGNNLPIGELPDWYRKQILKDEEPDLLDALDELVIEDDIETKEAEKYIRSSLGVHEELDELLEKVSNGEMNIEEKILTQEEILEEKMMKYTESVVKDIIIDAIKKIDDIEEQIDNVRDEFNRLYDSIRSYRKILLDSIK